MGEPKLIPFEEIDHTADLGLRVRGHDLKELFRHAAQGLYHLMRCTPRATPRPISRHIVLEAEDLEALLVDWLNELLYLNETNQEFYDTIEITDLQPGRLEATLHGVTHHPARKAIKAATFFDLGVQCGATGCEAAVTFDT